MRSRVLAGCWLTAAFYCCAQFSSPQNPTAAQNLQTGYCPQTRQLQAEPSQQLFLEGNIGDRPVRMFLDRGGSAVVGLFYYTEGDWAPTVLGGDWLSSGQIELTDGMETRPAKNRMAGKFDAQNFAGRWTSLNNWNEEPVRLSTIPKPDCNGKGPWKRFDDPRWPISFAYPANWLLHISDDSITLICPNPQEIAYGGEVQIFEGKGSPDGPTRLTQCSRGWRFGSECDCEHKEDLNCRAAKISRQSRQEILDVSDREWRIYCREGGYVAAGEGIDRVVLMSDLWLEAVGQTGPSAIIDQLIKTARPHLTNQPR